MKKLGYAAILALVVLVGLVLFLTGGTGPDDANSQPVTITLDDNFER